MRRVFGTFAFLVFSMLVGVAWYYVFFHDRDAEQRYWYWDATITLVWIDAAESEYDYGTGRGRYEIRLPSGRHVEARTALAEEFRLYECVRVRELLSALSYAPTHEIVGRADKCWQPD